MIPQPIEVALRYPLYNLYYLEDISNFCGLSDQEYSAFTDEYEESLRSEILNALKWVSEHPGVDLTNILPDIPFSNSDIHLYVGKILNSFVQEGGRGC